jgi:hypothetical protein
MNRDQYMVLVGVVAGAAILLASKYLIVGTDAWNQVFAPGTVEPASLVAFHGPFLTGVKDCPKCSRFWGLA